MSRMANPLHLKINMKHRLIYYFIFFIVALVIILWGTYFLKTHEKRITTKIDYSNPLAQYNDFLAAERFLQRLNIPTKTLIGREFLLKPPSKFGLLIVPKIDPDLSQDKIDALWQWIENGGQIITTINNNFKDDKKQSQTGFLARLNIQNISKYDYILDHKTLETCDIPTEKNHSAKEIVDNMKITKEEQYSSTWNKEIEIPIHFEKFSIETYTPQLLFDPDKKAQWGIRMFDDAYFLLHYQHGKGAITVLNNLHLFKNNTIHEKDNALLLALLADNTKQVWLLLDTNAVSIFTLLQRNLPVFSLLFCLSLGLLMWQHRRYTGPTKYLTDHKRHNLMDHLYASVNYRWNIDKNAKLLQQNQKSVEQHWLRRYPIMQQQNKHQRSQWIAKYSQLNAPDIEQALYHSAEHTADFIQYSHLLQILITE